MSERKLQDAKDGQVRRAALLWPQRARLAVPASAERVLLKSKPAGGLG
jgi:hypothetical protein